MHNLEQLFANWRQSMLAARNIAPETMDELEAHLRESVEKLVGAGMSEAGAFQDAVEQLGPSQRIAAEFQKLDQSTWLPVKVVVGLGVAAALLAAVHFFRIEQRSGLLLASHVFTVTLGYTTVYLSGALGICFICQRSFRDFSPMRRQSIAKISFVLTGIAAFLSAIGVILGAIWAHIEWGRAWSWDLKEIGGLSVVTWLTCLLLAQRLCRSTARGFLTMSVVGNVVVSLAWFGSNLFSNTHSYGTQTYLWFLLVAVFSNLAVFTAGLAPAGWLPFHRASPRR